MHSAPSDAERNVVPRWRSLIAISSAEAASVSRLKNATPLSSEQFADEISLWRRERTLEAAVDLMDAGIVTGNADIAGEGARAVQRFGPLAAQRVLDAARQVLVAPNGPLVERERLAIAEQSRLYISKTLHLLRRRVSEYPRDGMITLEMARLYTILGQNAQAEKLLRRSLTLMPDNRIALRAASLFYHLVGDLNQALRLLWQSDRVKFDPWVQSAEVAVADLADKGSRCAKSAVTALRGQTAIINSKSELAVGVATLELHAGVRARRVFQLVGAALNDPTENALAQAFWLGERTSRTLEKRYPGLQIPEYAHEARASERLAAKDYEGSLSAAHLWLRDQPFHPDPAVFIMFVSAIQLGRPESAIATAKQAVELHPGDWNVQNAALVVYGRSKNIEAAKACSKALERLAVTPTIRAFSEAGLGMIAYAEGNAEKGRDHYRRAMALARQVKRPDLVINAYIFHLLGESEVCRFYPEDLRRVIQQTDLYTRRISGADGDVSAIWESVRLILERLLEASNDLEARHENPGLIAEQALLNLLEEARG